MTVTAPTKRSYGWAGPDMPDARDHYRFVPGSVLQSLPASVDLRPQCPPVYDQGQLGACTSHAIAAALEFDQIKQQLPLQFVPSRLMIYYDERAMEGTVNSDAGARIRDGIKSVARQGACPEDLWPYDISQFAVQPPPTCYQNALQHRALSYQRVARHLSQMLGCLATGFPIIFGITVYSSFEDPAVMASGDVPMPSLFESVLGGHAMVLVSYDTATQRFGFRNSWGISYGQQGYGTIPFAYLLDPGLSSDFWTLETVS